jgi:hypothetical protein
VLRVAQTQQPNRNRKSTTTKSQSHTQRLRLRRTVLLVAQEPHEPYFITRPRYSESLKTKKQKNQQNQKTNTPVCAMSALKKVSFPRTPYLLKVLERRKNQNPKPFVFVFAYNSPPTQVQPPGALVRNLTRSTHTLTLT